MAYKINDEMIGKIEEYSRVGMSKAALCRVLGIARTTFNAWLNENLDVYEAMMKGKNRGDYEVAKALHDEAVDGNTTVLVHLSSKRLKNSEFNNDWGDALDKEETTVNVVLSEADIDKQLAELEGELTS
jgi:hypothetical protein